MSPWTWQLQEELRHTGNGTYGFGEKNSGRLRRICGVPKVLHTQLDLKDLERSKMKFCQTKEHKPGYNFYNIVHVPKVLC